MKAAPRLVNLRADWVNLIEAMYAEHRDDDAWADAIREAALPLLPHAMVVGFYSFEHTTELAMVHTSINTPAAMHAPFESIKKRMLVDEVFRKAWVPFHLSAPVATFDEIAKRMDADTRDRLGEERQRSGLGDGFGVIARPMPGVVTALHAMYDGPITMLPSERRALTQIALHIDAAHRARKAPEKITAELSRNGRIVWRDQPAPNERALGEHGARVSKARTTRERKTSDGIDLWQALLHGRVSLVPRGDRYLVLENEPKGHGLRSLTVGESTVLDLASKGLSTKLIAYGQGIAASAVSTRLASAAAKLGVMSRTELVRVAAMLTADARVNASEPELTAAEAEILELLHRGYSNRQIATRRSRSVRTIANQVAALLKKTKSGSRRELVSKS